MPACSCGNDSEEEKHGAIERIEVEMPYGQRHLSEKSPLPFSQHRDQLQADIARILARLELVEAHLGLCEKHRPLVENSMQEECEWNKQSCFQTSKEAEPDVEGGQKAELGMASSDDSCEGLSEVRFEESAWSIPVVAGLAEDVGWFDKLFAGMLIILNLGMQAAFSAVLLTDACQFHPSLSVVVGCRWQTAATRRARALLGRPGHRLSKIERCKITQFISPVARVEY